MSIIEYMHKYFFPKFTEITFFNIALVSLVLFFLYPGIREKLFEEIFSDLRAVILTIFYLIFIILSIYFAISDKIPNNLSSPFLVLFGVLIIAMIGIEAGFEVIKSYSGVQGLESLLLIFPVYNILHALGLVIFIRSKMFKPKLLYKEKNSDLRLVGLNAIFIIIFSVAVFSIGMSAAISASIMLFLMDLFEKLLDFFVLYKN